MYANLNVKPLQERCILGFSSPFRFLKDGNWRKGNDGMMLCSSPSGAVFRFSTDSDLSLCTTTYAPVRIIVVVKDDESEMFREKLLLVTSPQRMMVATDLDRPFDRNAHVSMHTTLVLAVAAAGLVIDVNVFGREVRNYQLAYDGNRFNIPYDLNVMGIAPLAMREYEMRNALELRNAPLRDVATFCSACYRVHFSNECNQRMMDKCPECHIVATKMSEHASQCSLKWFTSTPIDVYVKLPVIRCEITMESPMYWQRGEDIQSVSNGLVLASPMSDAYFKFVSDRKFEMWTTGFTRIRIPIVIHETTRAQEKLTEKLILLTSHDRTIIAAKGSRQVTLTTVLDDAFMHNTPLVLHSQAGGSPSLLIKIHSANHRTMEHRIAYDQYLNKYVVPEQLDVKSHQYLPLEFDAPLPKKKK